MAKWTKHPSGVIFSEVQGEPGKQFQHVIEKGLTSGYNLGRIHEDLDEPVHQGWFKSLAQAKAAAEAGQSGPVPARGHQFATPTSMDEGLDQLAQADRDTLNRQASGQCHYESSPANGGYGPYTSGNPTRCTLPSGHKGDHRPGGRIERKRSTEELMEELKRRGLASRSAGLYEDKYGDAPRGEYAGQELPQSTVNELESLDDMLAAAHGKVMTHAPCKKCGHDVDWVYNAKAGDNQCAECGSGAMDAMDMSVDAPFLYEGHKKQTPTGGILRQSEQWPDRYAANRLAADHPDCESEGFHHFYTNGVCEDCGKEQPNWDGATDAKSPNEHFFQKHHGAFPRNPEREQRGNGLDMENYEFLHNKTPELGTTVPDSIGGDLPGTVNIRSRDEAGPTDAFVMPAEESGLGYDAIVRHAPDGKGFDVLKPL